MGNLLNEFHHVVLYCIGWILKLLIFKISPCFEMYFKKMEGNFLLLLGKISPCFYVTKQNFIMVFYNRKLPSVKWWMEFYFWNFHQLGDKWLMHFFPREIPSVKWLMYILLLKSTSVRWQSQITAANWCHKVNQYLRFKNWIENKSCSGPQVFS